MVFDLLKSLVLLLCSRKRSSALLQPLQSPMSCPFPLFSPILRTQINVHDGFSSRKMPFLSLHPLPLYAGGCSSVGSGLSPGGCTRTGSSPVEADESPSSNDVILQLVEFR